MCINNKWCRLLGDLKLHNGPWSQMFANETIVFNKYKNKIMALDLTRLKRWILLHYKLLPHCGAIFIFFHTKKGQQPWSANPSSIFTYKLSLVGYCVYCTFTEKPGKPKFQQNLLQGWKNACGLLKQSNLTYCFINQV